MEGSYDENTKIWSGPKTEPLYNIEHHSLGKILYGQMRNYPNKVIQVDDIEGTCITNREALTWAIRLAQHFRAMGLSYDDKIGISARSTTYLMPVAVGCFLSCVPFHAVNPQYDEIFIAHCFNITRPSLIFCTGSDYDKIYAATKSFKPAIYTIAEHIEGVASVLDLLEPTKTEYFYQPEKLSLGSNQTMAILCSSGTTGLPKAVKLSVHDLIFENAIITSEDVLYSTSGLDWISGLIVMLVGCYLGCTRVISRKPFTPEYFIELSKKYQINYIIMAPNNILALTECPDFNVENFESLKVIHTTGASLIKKTLEKLKNVLPRALILYGYGLTEIRNISGYYGYEHADSAGKLTANMRLRIQDEEGNNFGPHKIGEIHIYSGYNWAGYYDNPTETQLIRDSMGWFHTGDLGYMDNDGFLYIVDRKKDICKYQGYHYWLSEIEDCIRELEDVIDCCVVGIPDPTIGDVAGALVIKSNESCLSEQEIIEHVKRNLKELQKQLHNGVVFVDELPHNFNGKVNKKQAKDIFLKSKEI